MCGRYVSATPPDQLSQYFRAELMVEPAGDGDDEQTTHHRAGNYNVAPTQEVYVVYENVGSRRLDRFRWGLVPFWAKDPQIGSKMINARAETIHEKNSFKGPFAKKRCILPADGFYEWKKVEGQKRKQPMYLTSIDGAPFAFAGVWDVWKDANNLDDAGEPLELYSCTIITGEPNEKVAEVHDRMPVILPPDAWDTWLDRDNSDIDSLRSFLVPAPAELIRLHPVSTDVNNVGNNRPSLIEKTEPVSDA